MVTCDRLEAGAGESCALRSWPRPSGHAGSRPSRRPVVFFLPVGLQGKSNWSWVGAVGLWVQDRARRKAREEQGVVGCHTLAMLQIGCRGPGWTPGASVQAETWAAGPGGCWGRGRRWLDRACAFEGPCQCARCVGRREEGLGQLQGSGLGSRSEGAMDKELGGGRRWAWGGGAWVWTDPSPGWVT